MSEKKRRFKIIYLRLITVIGISLFFVLSFKADIQVLEGSLSGSRMLGLHLTDPFIALEVFVTNHTLPVNLIIGTITILLFYFIFGGRIFCSWVCPYGLISEFIDFIRHKLIMKHIIKHRELNFNRYYFLIFWILLSVITGTLFFEMFNMVGIVSRFIIYGVSFASIFVLLMIILELFFGRFWCRGVCPVGTVYGLLSRISLGHIKWIKDDCNHCNKCINACYDKRILSEIINVRDNGTTKEYVIKNAGCNMCCKCLDSCTTSSFKYENKIKNII